MTEPGELESPSCAFCGKPRAEADTLIAGLDTHICGECVDLCMDLLDGRQDEAEKARRWGGRPASGSARHGVRSCGFCGKAQRDVRHMIAGPTDSICQDCVNTCFNIAAESFANVPTQRHRREPAAPAAPPDIVEPAVSCSFCGKPKNAVRKIVLGPGVHICCDCISLCNDVIGGDVDWRSAAASRPLHPPAFVFNGVPADAAPGLSCSFCGKSERAVGKLVAGPLVYICDDCVRVGNEAMAWDDEQDTADQPQ